MSVWICNGISQNGKQYPNQNPAGQHPPYENYSPDCAICGLPREAMDTHQKAKAVYPIAGLIAGLLTLGIFGLIAYLLFPKACSSGEQKVNGVCVAMSVPSPSLSATPASVAPSAATSTATSATATSASVTVIPGVAATAYRTLAEVVNVPAMTVSYGGSTTFAPLRSPAIVAKILQTHPGFKLSYTEPSSGEKPGSGNGIKMLLEGRLSLAQSSRPVKDDEFQKASVRGFTLAQIPVAIDGIALYINPQISLPGLTMAQAKDIFTGKITNWREVGGPDLQITPVSRDPKDGGTPEYFEDKVMEKQAFSASVQPFARDTTASIRQVAKTPGGIGYATASEVCNQASLVKPVAIARESGQPFISSCMGQQVNKAVFANDTYPITRRLFVVIKRDGSFDEQAGVAYANLLLSDEGQQMVDQAGLVPLRIVAP